MLRNLIQHPINTKHIFHNFARHLLRCIRWFNREKVTFLIASLALVLGAIYPWYGLPPQALETFETNLALANSARVLAAFFAIIGFAFTFCFSITRAPRLPFWSGLIAVLLFPYFITTWSPPVTFLATAYYQQNKQVSQHVESHFSDIQAQWKQNISLDESRAIKSIFNFSIKDSRFFQMSSWDQFLVEGLGYSNSVFGFIGRGWVFTVIGLVIGLSGLYLGITNDKFSVFLTDMGKFLPWVGLTFVILVFSLILPNIINHQLDTMFAKGQYHQVLATSQTLASWYPPLSGDEEFLQRMAEAGFYGNEPDPALMYFTKGLERYRMGDFRRAEDYFQQSLNIQPKRFLVRGYLATTVLNQGVNYFNDPDNPSNRMPGVAADRFEQVLRIFPYHVEALYDLMIASVVNGEFEKSALVAQQIIESQQYSQQPNLSLLGQAYVHSAWASYHKGDTTQAWKQYRQSVDRSAWKQTVEEEAE